MIQKAILGLLVCALLAAVRVKGDEPGSSESHIKALYLIKFAKYVEWPAAAFADSNAPITIGVVGVDRFRGELAQAVAGQSVNGRTFVIKHLKADGEPAGCQILFVGDSEAVHMGEILARAGRLPILTVGEDKQFVDQNGMINFVFKRGSVHLEINADSAAKAGLKISSKLLSVADTVKANKQRS